MPEDTVLQDLQEEAQSLTIINAREEEQQKATNLIPPRPTSRRQIPRCRRTLTCRTCRRRPRA